MAISYDNSAKGNGSFGGTTTPTTASFTVGAGANRMILVAVRTNSSSATPATGVTYNGVAMALVVFMQKGVGSNFLSLSLYALYAPASGANNVMITWGASYFVYAYNVVSYSGAAQSTPSNSASLVQTTSGSANAAMPITTLSNNSWAVIFLFDSFGGTISFTRGTLRQQVTSDLGIGDSNGAITPAGTYTFLVGSANTDSWQSTVVEIPQVATASANGNFFALM